MIRQIAARVHTALGRWLTDPPVAPKGKRSWFDCDPDTRRAMTARDPDEEETEVWRRTHFRNWPARVGGNTHVGRR